MQDHSYKSVMGVLAGCALLSCLLSAVLWNVYGVEGEPVANVPKNDKPPKVLPPPPPAVAGKVPLPQRAEENTKKLVKEFKGFGFGGKGEIVIGPFDVRDGWEFEWEGLSVSFIQKNREGKYYGTVTNPKKAGNSFTEEGGTFTLNFVSTGYTSGPWIVRVWQW